MHGVSILLSALLTTAAISQAQNLPLPRLAMTDPQALASLRQHPDAEVLRAATAEADRAMRVAPLSVTEKPFTPPSGDKHDYMSMAPYFWPNPKTANGLPYIRRDGEHNPETGKIPDHRNLSVVEESVHALALGYYFTGKEEYAAHAALLVRTWFLDPATRMNPNLEYAQAIAGVNTGRGIGILESRGLPLVCDALSLMAGAKSWTPQDDAAMRQWLQTYFAWLTRSDHGKDEAAAKNNHGSWFDVQAAGIALFLRDERFARQVVEEAKRERIARQIEADGRQPLELERTKSYSYSEFNLTALVKLAEIGDRVGVDLWDYRAPGGGSIRAALDYLLPYADNKAKWSYQAIDGMNADELRVPLLLAAIHFHNPSYVAAANKIDSKQTAELAILAARASH